MERRRPCEEKRTTGNRFFTPENYTNQTYQNANKILMNLLKGGDAVISDLCWIDIKLAVGKVSCSSL